MAVVKITTRRGVQRVSATGYATQRRTGRVVRGAAVTKTRYCPGGRSRESSMTDGLFPPRVLGFACNAGGSPRSILTCVPKLG
eukprot:2520211-Rhodomonas_salina.2